MVEVREIKKSLITKQDILLGLGTAEQVRNKQTYTLDMLNANSFGAPLIVQHYDQLINEQHPYYINPDYLTEPKLVYTADKGLFLIYKDGEWHNVTNNIAIFDTLDKAKTDFQGHNIVFVTDAITGGFFYYDRLKADINNGGTIIYGWVRIFQGAANAKWFGASGDGVTDDTKAIQNALDASDDVFIPAGTYIVTRNITLNENNTIQGVKYKTTLKSKFDITFIETSKRNTIENVIFKGLQSAQNQTFLFISGKESLDIKDVTIRDCEFVDSGKLAVVFDRIPYSSQVVLQSCQITNCKTAIEIRHNTKGVHISNCEFAKCEVAITAASDNFKLKYCEFSACGEACVKLDNIKPDVANNIRIENCDFRDSIKSLYFSGVENINLKVRECNFTSPIELYNTQGTIFTQCYFAGGIGAVDDISLSKSDYNTFENCKFVATIINQDVKGVISYNIFRNNRYYDKDLKYEEVSEQGLLIHTIANDFNIPSTPNTPKAYSLPLAVESNKYLPHSNGLSKFSFYDTANDAFTLKNPIGGDIVVDSVITLAHTAKPHKGSVDAIYLYKVLDEKQAVDYDSLDPDNLVAKFEVTPIQTRDQDNKRYIATLNATIPRGLYKIVIINESGDSNLSVLTSGQNLSNKPDAPQTKTQITFKGL